MSLEAPPSLRRQLVGRLLWPTLLLLGLAGVLTNTIALHFANLSYDRWLYDSLRSLTQQVSFENGEAQVVLSESAIEILEWDAVDQVFYSVLADSGRLVFGRSGFPPFPPRLQPATTPVFYNGVIDGQQVRVIALRLPPRQGNEGVTVLVAETNKKRDTLAREILVAILSFQALVVGAAVGVIWLGIKGGLKPLEDLATAIGSRTASDLGPLTDPVPREIQPLVHSLNDLLARLRSALLAQKRFIADASHQLRTPLTALQVQAERALRERNLEAHEQALQKVVSQIARVTHVAHQLLILASAEPDSQEHQRLASLDLARLAREATMEWVPTALGKEVDLGYSGPDAGVMVVGEARMLRELLGNLIDNALEYSGPGAQVTVEVGAEQGPVLVVEDNGPGIPAEARTKVFERFFRLPGSGGRGCGLGLAIVREIAQMHHAQVYATAGQGGRGTRIAISFGGMAEQRAANSG